MNTINRKNVVFTFTAFTVFAALAGCSVSKTDASPQPAQSATSLAAALTPSAAASAPVAPAEKPIEITISSVGDQMIFDKTMLLVQAGKTVHLTVKNHGTQAVMQHNWVLVKPGTEAAVALQGLNEAPDAGYVVPGPNVLAATSLTAPGGTTEVTFIAPAPGKYPYICTFPGHYITMKGVLMVTP